MDGDKIKTGPARKPEKKGTRDKIVKLGISLALTGVITAWGMIMLPGVTESLAGRLLWPLGRLTVLIFVGLAAGQLVETMGWTRRLAAIAAPLLSFGRLGPHCSAAFTAAFFSGTTANAMLLEFYRSGKISRRHLFIANLVNQVPAYFLHLPTTVFIVLPLTGKAGAAYFALTFSALVLRTFVTLACGRYMLAGEGQTGPRPAGPGSGSTRPVFNGKVFGKRLASRLAGVLTYVMPIYAAVFMVSAGGGFDLARKWLASFVTGRFVPVEAFSLVIIGFAAEFTSGFATAGALMHSGVLTVKEATLALLAGNIVAFPIRALRHQLPRLMGIFAPRLGIQILLLGQASRIVSLAGVGVVYYLL